MQRFPFKNTYTNFLDFPPSLFLRVTDMIGSSMSSVFELNSYEKCPFKY